MTTMVPVTGTAAIVSKIAESDPETARLFTEMGLFEVLGDMIDVYREEIDGVVSKAAQLTHDETRRALVRVYAERRLANEPVDDLLTFADSLEDIEKAEQFRENQHRRDPYTGRWVATLRGGITAGGRAKSAAGQINTWRQMGVVQPGQRVLLADNKGEYHAHTVGDGIYDDEKNIERLHGGRKDGFKPNRVEVEDRTNGRRPNDGMQHAFDAMNYAAGPDTASRLTPTSEAGFVDNMHQVTRQSSDGDRRAFRQLKAGGDALRAVSTPGSGTHAVGAVASLAGQLGPEAEKILGPGFARIGYRYRGTERTPDRALVNEVGLANRVLKPRPEGAPALPETNVGQSRAFGAYLRADSDPDLTPDQKVLAVRGDAAVGYLVNRVPDTTTAKLSTLAGKVPPSEGVIIDDTGNVVTQAVGFGEDHYLP